MTTHATTETLCTVCHCYVYAGTPIAEYDGATVHARCIATCDTCEEQVPSHDTWSVRDSNGYITMCDECHDHDAWECGRCGGHHTFNVERVYRAGYGNVCAHCVVHIEREERQNVIGSYHNQTRRNQTLPIHTAWTRQHGDRLFGVELEVERRNDAGEECHEIAHALLDVANDGGRLLWAEHDGSLCDGFELISQPMGLDKHIELWHRVLSVPASRELRSHDTRTCGLHVHVSRAGLSQLHVVKMVRFMNDTRNEMLVRAIARRYDSGYCKRKRVDCVRDARSGDRYEMLNVTPTRTVEFRAFRGTMRADTVLACVEFVNALVEWTRYASHDELTTARFLRYVYEARNARDTKHLRRYLARRVTVRMAPRYSELHALIEHITGTTPVAPSDTSVAPWAEI